MPTPTRRDPHLLRMATACYRALLLAACGLYGTLLYTVGQQRRELGIRMALGAGRGDLERQVVGKGLALAAVGSILGLGGFWAGSEAPGRYGPSAGPVVARSAGRRNWS